MNEKKELAEKLQEYRFVLIDTVLFLDSHPQNKKALEHFKEFAKKYADARKEYVEKYGPLTLADNAGKDSWEWVNNPWPWEIEV